VWTHYTNDTVILSEAKDLWSILFETGYNDPRFKAWPRGLRPLRCSFASLRMTTVWSAQIVRRESSMFRGAALKSRANPNRIKMQSFSPADLAIGIGARQKQVTGPVFKSPMCRRWLTNEMHLVCEPPASLAGAQRQRRVGAVHLAGLERKGTATLVSPVKSLHSRLFRDRVRCTPLRSAVIPARSLQQARRLPLHAPRLLASLQRILM